LRHLHDLRFSRDQPMLPLRQGYAARIHTRYRRNEIARTFPVSIRPSAVILPSEKGFEFEYCCFPAGVGKYVRV
jgi:hypothetical protein